MLNDKLQFRSDKIWQYGMLGEVVKKCSDGCLHCYIYKEDFKRNVNTNEIVKTKNLTKQAKLANINYKANS